MWILPMYERMHMKRGIINESVSFHQSKKAYFVAHNFQMTMGVLIRFEQKKIPALHYRTKTPRIN